MHNINKPRISEYPGGLPTPPLVTFSCQKTENRTFLLEAQEKSHQLVLSCTINLTEKEEGVLSDFSSSVSDGFSFDPITEEVLSFFQYQILKKIMAAFSVKKIKTVVFSMENALLEKLSVFKVYSHLIGTVVRGPVLSTVTISLTADNKSILMKKEIMDCRKAKERLFKEEKRNPLIRSYLKAVKMCDFWVLRDHILSC